MARFTPAPYGLLAAFIFGFCAAPPARAATYRVIHSFLADAADGQYPAAPLLPSGGALFGTTLSGGAFDAGTVFQLRADGTEHVVHAFGTGRDGDTPATGLTALNGTLYGMTESSTVPPSCTGCGGAVLYAILPDGAERVVHKFQSFDAQSPGAGLIAARGALYGSLPGPYGDVFSLGDTGAVAVLHGFRGPPSDGSDPAGPLLAIGTGFIGTTAAGGSANGGTLFTLSTNAGDHVVYAFGGVTDDATSPVGALLAAGNGVMGVAEYGGGGGCDAGCGAIYMASLNGQVTLVHRFSGPDGANPMGGLVLLHHVFYGTSSAGGAFGQGVLFSLTADHGFTVLHDFGSGTDGARPVAALVVVGDTLYGTTLDGGAHQRGTVFAYTP